MTDTLDFLVQMWKLVLDQTSLLMLASEVWVRKDLPLPTSHTAR